MRILIIILLPVLLLGCISLGPKGQFSNGMIVYSDEIAFWDDDVSDDGEYMLIYYDTILSGRTPGSVKLATNWKNKNTGQVYKRDTTVLNYPNGDLEQFTLAREWTDPEQGIVIAADSRVYFFEGYRYRSIELAEDLPLPDIEEAVFFKAGSRFKWHENGNNREYTLRYDYRDPQTGMVFKAGEAIEWHENGSLKKVVLAVAYHHPGSTVVYAADSPVKFFDDGRLQNCLLGSDLELADNVVLKQGSAAVFNADGNLQRGTFLKSWTDPQTGITYEANKEYTFD